MDLLDEEEQLQWLRTMLCYAAMVVGVLVSDELDKPERPLIPDQRLDLSALSDEDAPVRFRFTVDEIRSLCTHLRIPGEWRSRNRLRAQGWECVCIMLRKLAHPCTWDELTKEFGRSPAALSALNNEVLGHVHHQFQQKLVLDVARLVPLLPRFSDAIRQKGSPLQRCWGFIDGTLRETAR
jgi:hypothetical protein